MLTRNCDGRIFTMDYTLVVVVTLLLLEKSKTFGDQWTRSCPDVCLCDTRQSQQLNVMTQTVNCSHSNLANKLPNIPADVETLNVQRSNITEIHNAIPRLIKLKEINLSFNRIKHVGHSPIFANLTQLQYLNLDHNRISTLFHGTFSGLRRLDSLILSNNQIFSIEEHSFGGLTHLQTLDLSGNKLTDLNQQWFDGVPHLRTLLLHHNKLSAIPDFVFRPLSVLGTLSLSNNNLRRLHVADFKGIENLQSLFLDNAELSELPHRVLDLFTDLRVLSLSGNKFSRISENQFSRLPLRELMLTNLPLLKFVDQKAFHDLPHLRILQLNDNPRLRFIDSNAFDDVPMLTKLLAHNNNLATLPHTLVTGIPSLSEITFYHNALQCDCNSFWIREIMTGNVSRVNKLTFSQADKYVCQQPEANRGMLLNGMSLTKLPKTCPSTTIEFFEQDIVVEVGDKLRLDCRGIGVPQPYIYWERPGGVVINATSRSDQYQVLPSGSLILDPVKLTDGGRYTCVSKNSVGSGDKRTTLLKVRKKNIHVIPQGIGTNFITVTWNGTSIPLPSTNYQILYKQLDSAKKFHRIHISPPLRKYTINKLTPNTDYRFCIAFEHFVQVLQISCVTIKTRDQAFDENGITIYDMTTVTVLTVLLAAMFLVCIAIFVVKRVKRRKSYKRAGHRPTYDVAGMSQIPLDNLYNPQSTPLIGASAKQALLA